MYKHRIIKDNEIIAAATLMDVVYEPLETIPRHIGDISLSYTISIKDTDLGIFTDKKENTIYIVFRGTSDIYDVITDIQYFPKKFIDTKAHRGFVRALENVLPDILRSINSLVRNIHATKLFFCGHSLGGGLAQLAFYYTIRHLHDLRAYKQNIFCITEGSPMVFSSKYLTRTHDIFKKQAIRITHADDIIPNLPPRTLFLRLLRNSYTHVGEHWNIGIPDYEDGIHEHYADKYLTTLKKEVNE